MNDFKRLHETEPDEADLEIAAAQQERATFEARLDAYASLGIPRPSSTADGIPTNDGAAAEYLAGRDLGGARDDTGIGVPMMDAERGERTDYLGAPAESLMQGPTTLGGGGGSSRRKQERTPNVMERMERQERRMASYEVHASRTDEERARKALLDHERRMTAGGHVGRPPKGQTPTIAVHRFRVESQVVVDLQEAGLGKNVGDMLHTLARPDILRAVARAIAEQKPYSEDVT